MRAGALRHRVDIQQATEGTPDATGETLKTWSDWATDEPAEILPQQGREWYAAAQLHGELTHLVRIRYRADVDSTMRLKLGTRYLHIMAITNPKERNRELLLTCKEEV
jgi:SPP1 family predicted phage head-tail adaptor